MNTFPLIDDAGVLNPTMEDVVAPVDDEAVAVTDEEAVTVDVMGSVIGVETFTPLDTALA